ncbi:hypothetical protein CEQ31_018815 [Serratia odorifera]|nr:hypothetical protein CEQ31_018815 [Serratia odorifera]RII72848.1 hypothetical protein DX901_07625 [Serratia odorifera]
MSGSEWIAPKDDFSFRMKDVVAGIAFIADGKTGMLNVRMERVAAISFKRRTEKGGRFNLSPFLFVCFLLDSAQSYSSSILKNLILKSITL